MNNLNKSIVASIGQILLEFGCSEDQTADYVAERVETLMSLVNKDEAFNEYIAEQVKSIALVASDEKSLLSHPDEYDELKKLDESIEVALNEQNTLFENSPSDFEEEYFTIIVGDRIHQFLLGGPQTAALSKFISHICYENMYPEI